MAVDPHPYFQALSENRLSLTGSVLLGSAVLAPFYLPLVPAAGAALIAGTAGASLLKSTVPTTMRGYRFTTSLLDEEGSLDGLTARHPSMGSYYCSQAGSNAAARERGFPIPFPDTRETLFEMALPRIYAWRRKR